MIPTPGRFLELESQRADSLRFLKKNRSNPIVGPIPQITIPTPGGFLEKTAKDPAPCDSDSRNRTKPILHYVFSYRDGTAELKKKALPLAGADKIVTTTGDAAQRGGAAQRGYPPSRGGEVG